MGAIRGNDPGSKLVIEYFLIRRYLLLVNIVSKSYSSRISKGRFIFWSLKFKFSIESKEKLNSYLKGILKHQF